MGAYHSYNQIQMNLVEAAERLGRKTVSLGLLPGFTVQYLADTIHFSVVDYPNLLTPEEAYQCFQRLIEEFDAIPAWLVNKPLKLVQWAIADF
ncbi:MAG: hypothetical protein Kow00121_07240 [Elainellaceae cyanobacterium]